MNANATTLAAAISIMIWCAIGLFFFGVIRPGTWWLRMALIVIGLTAYAVGAFLLDQIPLSHP